MYNEYLSKRFSTQYQAQEQRRKQQEAEEAERQRRLAELQQLDKLNGAPSSPITLQATPRGKGLIGNKTATKSTNPRSKEVMEQNRQQQAAVTKQVADKWEVAVWRDVNIFNSTPVFAQVGITEDMIRFNKVPSKYVDAALKLLYKGYSGDKQNAAIAPNKEQYNSVINEAQANPQGPLSSKINAYVTVITKADEKAKNKQHKEYIKNIRSGGNDFNSVDVKKSKEENIQALVKKMDSVYSEYMSTPQDTEKFKALESECDNLFNSIASLVTNNMTTKVLVAEAISNLRNGNTPPWLEDGDMVEINNVLNTEAAGNIRRLRAQDVGVFENDTTLWKDKSTGQDIKIMQM